MLITAAIAAFACAILVAIAFRLSASLKDARASLQDVSRRHDSLADRYGALIDADAELVRVKDEAKRTAEGITSLKKTYKEKHEHYSALLKETAIFDERLAFAEVGMYSPHFDFTDSDRYKEAALANREDQQKMIKDKTAVVCDTAWTVEGSAAKGQTMINRSIKLMLRAFNGECDAAVSNARWNNVAAMEKRIVRAFEQINGLGESNRIEIQRPFLDLKLTELRLAHEQREKLKAEKEERAEAARAAREEQKLLRDMEKAEDDEEHYKKLLDKARKEAASIAGPQLEVFQKQIEMLEKDLAAAHAKFERAQAMAEKTRSGYVYIISNVGSLGADVVKIGLTRRLDPADRIRELGDASVPFLFDTHAVIYSDNAPSLERSLHARFEPVRVNPQNYRKEFFRTTIEEVEAAVRELAPDAPFFKDVEAQEYRETLARRKAALIPEVAARAAFPSEI